MDSVLTLYKRDSLEWEIGGSAARFRGLAASSCKR
jgi:hypothetical protein